MIVSNIRCVKCVNSLLYLEILSYMIYIRWHGYVYIIKISWFKCWMHNDLWWIQWYSKGDTYNLIGRTRNGFTEKSDHKCKNNETLKINALGD